MYTKSIRIGNKTVGDNHPCYIIAEIGSNFDRSLTKAKKLIKLAKKCGADAAKFQSFKTEKLLSKKGFKKKVAFQNHWKKSVWQVYKDAELPRNWHKELNRYARKIGIHFFTSPWDFEAVDLLAKLNVSAIKIGSGDITYLEILKHIALKKKPILLATGASTLKEIKNAIDVIKLAGNKKIILLHSVTQYPSPLEEANLKALETLKKKFHLLVGYSDHSLGTIVPLASVALGACVIEKHFTTNSSLIGPDHPHSMDPTSFFKMVDNIRSLEKAMGKGKKIIQPSEKLTRIIQRRGIWTVKKISKGKKFTTSNIKPLRPVYGISAEKYQSIIGKRAKKNFQSYVSLTKKDL